MTQKQKYKKRFANRCIWTNIKDNNFENNKNVCELKKCWAQYIFWKARSLCYAKYLWAAATRGGGGKNLFSILIWTSIQMLHFVHVNFHIFLHFLFNLITFLNYDVVNFDFWKSTMRQRLDAGSNGLNKINKNKNL